MRHKTGLDNEIWLYGVHDRQTRNMVDAVLAYTIAELHLQGSSADDIVHALRCSGVTEPDIQGALANFQNSNLYRTFIKTRWQHEKRDSLLKSLDWYGRLDPRARHVPVTQALPYSVFLHDYLSKNRPVVMRGAFDHWPARNWDLACLARKIGADTPVEVEHGRDDIDDPTRFGSTVRKTMSFGAFVQEIGLGRSDNCCLTAQNFFMDQDYAKPILGDIGDIADGYLDPSKSTKTRFLWIGSGGVTTGLHEDHAHILFCQIMGHKKFTLYPAVQIPYMYNNAAVFSDVKADDKTAFPLFERTTGIDLYVSPGDMLFIPMGWWHRVQSETQSISLSLTNLRDLPNSFVEYPYETERILTKLT